MNNCMHDYVTPEERLGNKWKLKESRLEIFIVVVLMFFIGSMYS